MGRLFMRSRAAVRPALRLSVAARPRRFVRWNSTDGRSLVEELEERGLAESITGPAGQLSSFVDSQKVVVYAGVDPTAASLHVGHLLPLMSLLHFYLHGHRSIGLIGQATAAVGDPSGRMTDRDSIESTALQSSSGGLWLQLTRFFDRGAKYAVSRGYDRSKFGTAHVLTNGDWLGKLKLVDFLSTIGRHVRVGQMLARESVKARMGSAQGINYAEFTYQLLQSYDFWHLHQSEGCRLQVGGNDQYGNITAGIDLIARLQKSSGDKPPDAFEPAYGLTVPLLTTAAGEKFGKSAGNAVWLDERLTSPFELYQHFVKLPDEVVAKHFKVFTLLSAAEIDRAVRSHAQSPGLRIAQHCLAQEVVTLIHGKANACKAFVQTQLLYPRGSAPVAVSAQQILDAFEGENCLVAMPKEEVVGAMVGKVIRRAGVVKSKSEAENILKGGGVYFGQEGSKVLDPKAAVKGEWLIDGSILLLRVGKSNFTIVQAV